MIWQSGAGKRGKWDVFPNFASAETALQALL